MGPQALTYLEIAAWARLMGEAPRPWEVEALLAMDVARRAALNEEPDGPGISAAAFDAVFG